MAKFTNKNKPISPFQQVREHAIYLLRQGYDYYDIIDFIANGHDIPQTKVMEKIGNIKFLF